VGVTAIIQVLDGLKDDEGAERIAFKGGAALELRFGFRARASNDLDGAYRGEVAEAIGLIDEVLKRGWSGFTGRTTEGEPIIGTGLAVPPVRFRVKLLYKGKDFVTVPMELSPVEGRSLDQVEVLPAAVSLAPVQLPEAESIPFLPIRYQVAQKLHACTEDAGEDRPNQRAPTWPTSSSSRSWRSTRDSCPVSGRHASRSSGSVTNIRGRRPLLLGRAGTKSGNDWWRPKGSTVRSPRPSPESRLLWTRSNPLVLRATDHARA